MGFLNKAAARRRFDTNYVRDLEGKVAAMMRSQAVIEFELNGTIIGANRNFLDTLGYAESEVVGRAHAMFVDPAEAGGEAYREFWRTLNRGEFVAAKFRRLGKGGREVWIQASYNPILDENGRPVKVVKFASDITATEHERAQAERDRVAAVANEQAMVVNYVGAGLKRLADGDLTATIDPALDGAYGRIRDDFHSAVDRLREAVASVVESSGALRNGSEEIAAASDNLSRRTEQQAASLEQTAAALDQITATVKRSADGAKQASEVASGARQQAERSGEVMQQAVAAMRDIRQSSGKISQIIGVIDEIAFQTNLLALNAGVEAARAGDAGRGFAVVAQEVRGLAQRSAEAAKEIKELIASSTQQVERGVKLVGETGQALGAIVERVASIDGLVSAISLSAQEQSTGLHQVNSAVNQMDQVTQQNAAMVEEATAAASQLKSETGNLVRRMARFHVGEAAASTNQPGRGAPAAQQRLQVVVGGERWSEF